MTQFTFFWDSVLSKIKKVVLLETLNCNSKVYGRHCGKEEHASSYLCFKGLTRYLVWNRLMSKCQEVSRQVQLLRRQCWKIKLSEVEYDWNNSQKNVRKEKKRQRWQILCYAEGSFALMEWLKHGHTLAMYKGFMVPGIVSNSQKEVRLYLQLFQIPGVQLSTSTKKEGRLLSA